MALSFLNVIVLSGYVELPDGKVVSGAEWGNMLLWDGGLIRVEISMKGKKSCHQVGPPLTLLQFAMQVLFSTYSRLFSDVIKYCYPHQRESLSLLTVILAILCCSMLTYFIAAQY